MIERVISGFQTGADSAGIRAAVRCKIPTGGWMPRGFLTETGPRPEYAETYGAREQASDKYPPRTIANATESDATIWFGADDSRGFGCTAGACRKAGKPLLIVRDGVTTPRVVVDWIHAVDVRSLNVAGTRASKAPGIEERVERFLVVVFGLLEQGR